MIPLIGNQVIEFGDGNDYVEKFRRLFIFYKEVCKTGFEKYSRIDVQYAGQVIGTRRGGPVSKNDSLQAMRNYGHDPDIAADGSGYRQEQGSETAGEKPDYRTET